MMKMEMMMRSVVAADVESSWEAILTVCTVIHKKAEGVSL